MKATSEPIAFVLRIHPDDTAEIGAPYSASVSVTIGEDRVATLHGLVWGGSGAFPVAAGLALDAELGRLGAREVVYSRRVGGSVRVVRRRIRG